LPTNPKKSRSEKAVKPVLEKPLQVPQILLEDDTSSFTAAPVLGDKFVLSQRSGTVQGQRAELPEAYGTGKLLLTPRDPHWLYAHWDLTRNEQREHNARSIHGHLVLRLHATAIAAKPMAEVHVHPESQHWFIHVERAGTTYTAELGYYRAPGKWITVAKTAAVTTPPEAVATDKRVEFLTINPDVPLAQIGKVGEGVVAAISAEESNPEHESEVAEFFSSAAVGPAQRGSGEVPELMGGRLGQGAAWSGVSEAGAEGFEGGWISSPRGGEAGEQQGGFWLNVNAELVIYGGTEPGASVTVDGQPIQLRPDGTFSFRFALPDGRYEVIIGAMSEAGDVRQARLNFTRRTEREGEVGVQAGEELGEMGTE
jgi:hypothetical protein